MLWIADSTGFDDTDKSDYNCSESTTSYRFQFKSYLPIAAKRWKALAPRFPQPLCQIGLNLESVSAVYLA